MVTLGAILLIWSLAFYESGHPEALRYALAFLGVVLVMIASRPGTWRATPVFAADRCGIYLVHRNGRDFTHVPWEHVGDIGIGYKEGVFRSVVVDVRLKGADWRVLSGHRSGGMDDTLNEYRKIPIGNACRDVETTLRKIESVRRQAADWPAYRS